MGWLMISDKLITLVKSLCVLVGISFLVMLVAIFFPPPGESRRYRDWWGEREMNRVLCVVIIVLAVGYGALWLATNHYRDNALTYKAQRDKKARELEQANATITDMQVRQRDVAALDAKYSRELADARAENETLRADVAAGRKRLRINATCSGTVREATGTSGVDNATGPRLADTAERDYFILRERLMTMQKQLEGAQDYIRTQCLN